MTTAAYRVTATGGQVRNDTTADLSTRRTRVRTEPRVTRSSRVTGLPKMSRGGATMISKRCCTMCALNSTSS